MRNLEVQGTGDRYVGRTLACMEKVKGSRQAANIL